ncbi:ABC-three component system protein [Marinobacter sp. GN3S48]|uniref:ABC-three component system protein n=1 Tax=Marinobacter sp. GN3S48 TaxID=3382302 RepID=UPI00387B2BDC
MAFDASPSWSGFNYQGKVALYYALRLINGEPNGKDLSNYSLMLEATEDFEILCDGIALSYHQVKAYNTSTYSKYSNALLGITLALYNHPNAFGRIHTWMQINPKPGFVDLRSSIQHDLDHVLSEYREKTPKDGSTILEKAASTAEKIPKQAAILRAAFPGYTADLLYDLLESIRTGQNNTLSRLDSHQYEDNNRFCDLDAINDKIKAEISTALQKRGIVITDGNLEKTFQVFLGIIDQHVIYRHKNKEGDSIPLSFSEIVDALEVDHEDIGREYLACKFKAQFAQLIDQYIRDPEDYEEPEEDAYCNLKEAKKRLLSLSPQDLWAHYRSFSPQTYLQHDCNTENAFGTNMEGIRHVLLKILHTINFERASHNASNNQLIYRTTTLPYQYYLPTTITHVARPTQIEKQIKENLNMSEVLFEVENLIYSGSEPHSFSPTAITHTEAPAAVDADPRSKREEVLKRITLVPISTAKDALSQ